MVMAAACDLDFGSNKSTLRPLGFSLSRNTPPYQSPTSFYARAINGQLEGRTFMAGSAAHRHDLCSVLHGCVNIGAWPITLFPCPSVLVNQWGREQEHWFMLRLPASSIKLCFDLLRPLSTARYSLHACLWCRM